ncbi:MAG TPA: alcohol dehydrogenase catalytic domain-containing protein [Candidatus Hydrogenedentes bacterium]|nr:alcohol dehydrogenase catalytic domain-containing protein [Candidatus Hydrogenedentota bacterium]HRT20933.1 alcohol dehydrogenase catalytic domain-containing protein [Candidatus Hydrogenedentota bacterium]HRT63456.1 alcohol dehydrogenase catalytic domain-containing protein [Candidatus Hydrogenedentota bacterium]
MRALVFDGELRVTELPIPRPGEGEALIRVLTAGICNTDLEILRGYLGFRGVPGHEFVGVVEQCANPNLQGKRVTGEINCVCHKCPFCQLEMPHHCLNRTVLGIAGRQGAFAEFVTLPEENLHIVPASIRDDVAVFTEPLAAAFRIVEQIPVTANDRVVVLGDGKLGQLCAQVLWLLTKKLLCIGKHEWKLALLNALHIPTALKDDPVERNVDMVVEATGSPEGIARALELVRPEGAIVLKTTLADTGPLNLSLPVINEIRIIGSRCGPFRPALEALASNTVEVRPMITETYELRDADVAMQRAAAPDVLKVLLHI